MSADGTHAACEVRAALNRKRLDRVTSAHERVAEVAILTLAEQLSHDSGLSLPEAAGQVVANLLFNFSEGRYANNFDAQAEFARGAWSGIRQWPHYQPPEKAQP